MDNIYTDRNGRPLKPGDRVAIDYPDDLARERSVGVIYGAFPTDAQGVAGCVTVHLGMGVHEYVAPKFLTLLEP